MPTEKTMPDLSIWEGDGLPDYEGWADFVYDLDITMPELEAWFAACKGEAWVHEKVAKHEDTERNLAVARYFWRRTEKLREYIDTLGKELDKELDKQQKP